MKSSVVLFFETETEDFFCSKCKKNALTAKKKQLFVLRFI